MTDLDLSPDADDPKLLAQVVDYYQRALKATPKAIDYLRNRGINHGQALEQFRIGYAGRTLGLHLPPRQNRAGKAVRARLATLNLFRASGHEHFAGCIVFPIFAPDGSRRIVDMYGRKLLGKMLKKRCLLDLHLGADRRGVWNLEGFGQVGGEIILCPSIFDALTFWCHGFRNVTCTFGSDHLNDDLLSAFKEFHVGRVLTSCVSVLPQLLEAGLDCFHLKFPAGLDANGYALRKDDMAAALSHVVRHAEWIGNGARGEGRGARGEKEAASRERERPEESADATLRLPDEDDDDDDDDEPEDDEEEEETDIQESAATPEASRPPDAPPSPLPAAPHDLEAELSGDARDEVTLTIGDRRYRIRGLGRNLAYDVLRVNVLASGERGLFVDTFDLYSARHRKAFVAQAAAELGVEEKAVKKDLGRVLLKLEELQDAQIQQALKPKETVMAMSSEEKEAALQLLRDPELLERVVADFALVGEATNKLAGYLAAISRKLDQPLAVIVQSSSAAGKTALMDAVLDFVPPEDAVKFSAMTGQSLYYMEEKGLKHKVLALVEEEGAQRASYALKLLQSEGELQIASTGKDVSSGRLVTQVYRVEGPVMIFLTTTAVEVDEELLNRCLVLTVNEDREQTKAIHRLQRQRQTLAGQLAAQEHDKLLTLHRNAQRLLRPLLVANPYAEALTFLDAQTRSRRDHVKYLTLIRAIALLHQYQRPLRTATHNGQEVQYIEVAPEDIETANRLAAEVLGRSGDDLPPQTQRLLRRIEALVTRECQRRGVDRSDYRFSRRAVREAAGWGQTQLAIHLRRLEELEYLLVHRGGRGQSFVYELLHGPPAEPGAKFLAGLIDVARLRDRPEAGDRRPEEGGSKMEDREAKMEDREAKMEDREAASDAPTYEYDVNLSGVNANLSGGCRGQIGPKSGGCRPSPNDANPGNHAAEPASEPKVMHNAHREEKKIGAS